jgi:cytochrome P450
VSDRTCRHRRFDLYGAEFRSRRPEVIYRTYAEMRASDPVSYQSNAELVTFNSGAMGWWITSSQEVEKVLLDARHFSRDQYLAAMSPEQEAFYKKSFADKPRMVNHMLAKEGSDHHRLRRVAARFFSAEATARRRERVTAVAGALIDQLAPRHAMEVIEDYAAPLTSTVVGELLGIPPEDLHHLCGKMVEAAYTQPSPEAGLAALARAAAEQVRYLSELFEQCRREDRDTVFSAYVKAYDQGLISEDELFSAGNLFIGAGHDTTMALIANALLALLTHPAQLQLLLEDRALLPRALEEALRHDGPVERGFARWTTEDTTVGGKLIQRGEVVIPVLAAANRDPAQHPDPDVFDIRRDHVKHAAFGRGVHHCLGERLARLEAEIAIDTVLRRLPGLRLAIDPNEIRYWPYPNVRRPAHLPLAWD